MHKAFLHLFFLFLFSIQSLYINALELDAESLVKKLLAVKSEKIEAIIKKKYQVKDLIQVMPDPELKSNLTRYLEGRLSDGKQYAPSKSIKKKLKQQKPCFSNKKVKFGAAKKEIIGRNIILHLKGTPYVMGYQHGFLLKKEIRKGVVPLFANPIDMIPEYRQLPEWIKRLLLLYYEYKIYRPIEKNTPLEYLKELKGMADGACLKYRPIFIANFLSDFSMAMLDSGSSKAPECSDFVAVNQATSNGKMIIGRNTDYSGQGRWLKYQTLFFYEPEDQNKYAKVSSAGMLKCNTAMNEKGMVVGGHFMSFSGSTPAGFSFTIFENEIMRKSGSIPEALAILNNNPRGGSFGLTISDSKTRHSVVVEATSSLIGIREMENDLIWLTNHATTAQLAPADFMLNYNIGMRNSYGRFKRFEQLLTTHYGAITPRLAAGFMGDHFDITAGQERGIGNIIGTHTNVTSVIFSPEDGYFWVATGGEPACNNQFIGFDFNARLGISPAHAVNAPVLPGYAWNDQAKADALPYLMSAFIQYSEQPEQISPVLQQLNRAKNIDVNEPAYSRLIAEIYIKEQQFNQALANIHAALNLPQSNNEKAVLLFYLGFINDILGKRDAAVQAYNAVLNMVQIYGFDYINGINAYLYQLTNKGTKEAYTLADLGTIAVSFTLSSNLD